MSSSNKFDSAFRKRAREIKIKPSPGVWDQIDQNISGRRKRTSLYTIIGIAASLLLLVGFFGLFQLEKTQNEVVATNYTVDEIVDANTSAYSNALMKWVNTSKEVGHAYRSEE